MAANIQVRITDQPTRSKLEEVYKRHGYDPEQHGSFDQWLQDHITEQVRREVRQHERRERLREVRENDTTDEMIRSGD